METSPSLVYLVIEENMLFYSFTHLICNNLFYFSTFVCPTELIAFSDRINEFRKLNCEVFGISVDSIYTHHAWSNTPRKNGGLLPISFPLIADLDKSICKSYGVLHNDAVALRGLFIIDDKGVVRQSTINDLPIGRSVDEAIRLVEAIQYFEANGEVCPANWKPGKATVYKIINPILDKSQPK